MSTYKGNCSIFTATIQLTADPILKMKVKLSLAYGLSTSLNQKRKVVTNKKDAREPCKIKEAILHIKEHAYKIVEAKNCKIIK